ncbi:kinase-like domain-containing protein [Coniella lustricola]|uniref:Kinase-like domain-containing protein n=1 Tax=Coniella lustricola TaxID=2025994 RepID=A0A2T3AN36_9PEZI|nr:kinase-like domain-containing protein [Coniella lustricola]
MASETPAEDAVQAQILKELDPTAYACTSLRKLSGGTANYIFQGQLKNTLSDGTFQVVIKHGEAFSASSTSLKLPTKRCILEKDSLAVVRNLPAATSSSCSVRTPRLLDFISTSNTQVLECLPESLNLKAYVLKHYSSTAASSLKQPMIEVGRGLGRWLRSFHDWAASPAQRDHFCALARKNTEMRDIKFKYNYELLLARVDAHPDLLSTAKTVFEQVLSMIRAELQDDEKLQAIHGDFWTGNILLPDTRIESDRQTPLFVIDWEMVQLWLPQLDLGQMIAELYELHLYKNITAGLWLIEGFVAGYGFVSDDFALRTALHVGTHLVGFGSMVPGWGTAQQARNVVEVGRDIVLRAWDKDTDWFQNHDLARLFQHVTD